MEPRLAMGTGDDFVSIKGASEFLGVCPNTLRSWGATGKVHEYRQPINNYRLYKQRDLDDLRERLLHPHSRYTGMGSDKG